MSRVEIRHLNKIYGPAGNGHVVALQDFSLDIRSGEFICLLGPSGCGKTTALNIVAGLLKQTSGEVLVDGRRVTGPGPERAYVFQDYALFPWMSVAENVAFGLESQGWAVAERLERAHAILKVMGLDKFARSYPKQLSGGMRQRVSIARALAVNPRVLLMDEPFAALDAFTRAQLQDELLSIWEALGKTVLFVTHNIDEAVQLADRIVVMTSRPGRMKLVVETDLPRPRDVTSPRYLELVSTVRAALSEEMGIGHHEAYRGLADILGRDDEAAPARTAAQKARDHAGH